MDNVFLRKVGSFREIVFAFSLLDHSTGTVSTQLPSSMFTVLLTVLHLYLGYMYMCVAVARRHNVLSMFTVLLTPLHLYLGYMYMYMCVAIARRHNIPMGNEQLQGFPQLGLN